MTGEKRFTEKKLLRRRESNPELPHNVRKFNLRIAWLPGELRRREQNPRLPIDEVQKQGVVFPYTTPESFRINPEHCQTGLSDLSTEKLNPRHGCMTSSGAHSGDREAGEIYMSCMKKMGKNRCTLIAGQCTQTPGVEPGVSVKPPEAEARVVGELRRRESSPGLAIDVFGGMQQQGSRFVVPHTSAVYWDGLVESPLRRSRRTKTNVDHDQIQGQKIEPGSRLLNSDLQQRNLSLREKMRRRV
ncbi:hypothetical protein B0H11DRAFT_1940606 [Mycena galericulata]|nr:hypothetical protein B0H11DRAFT_1940606 [Mycena galericulata]